MYALWVHDVVVACFACSSRFRRPMMVHAAMQVNSCRNATANMTPAAGTTRSWTHDSTFSSNCVSSSVQSGSGSQHEVTSPSDPDPPQHLWCRLYRAHTSRDEQNGYKQRHLSKSTNTCLHSRDHLLLDPVVHRSVLANFLQPRTQRHRKSTKQRCPPEYTLPHAHLTLLQQTLTHNRPGVTPRTYAKSNATATRQFTRKGSRRSGSGIHQQSPGHTPHAPDTGRRR